MASACISCRSTASIRTRMPSGSTPTPRRGPAARSRAIRRGRFGCAWPPRARTRSRGRGAIRRRIWCAEGGDPLPLNPILDFVVHRSLYRFKVCPQRAAVTFFEENGGRSAPKRTEVQEQEKSVERERRGTGVGLPAGQSCCQTVASGGGVEKPQKKMERAKGFET